MVKLTNAFIYIMSNKTRTTFYIGVTNNLARRVQEHKSGKGSVFTSRYFLFDLVYFETNSTIESAIKREKQLKRWHRDWKINLIKSQNPEFIDLAKDWISPDPETFQGDLLLVMLNSFHCCPVKIDFLRKKPLIP